MPDPLEEMPERIERDMAEQEANGRGGQTSLFTCPECGGAMWQVDDQALARFRCHVGHAYYGETLLAEQSEALEAALWTAVRVFREKTMLTRQLAAMHREKGSHFSADRFRDEALVAERYGNIIQQLLLGGTSAPPGQEPVQPPPGPDDRAAPADPNGQPGDSDSGTSG
jgi:two-component system chemotaxis response regulator CheB